MSFSALDHPSSPLFKRLKILKFSDIVTFQNAVLMYKFHNNMLPHAFKSFFNKVDQVHKYNTRLAAKQSYYIAKVRTNYGIFNLRYKGPNIWNVIDTDIKNSSLSSFKKKLRLTYLDKY